MVDKITPSYHIVPSGTTIKPRDREAKSVDTFGRKKGAWKLSRPQIDRRNGEDRRKYKQGRLVYDMRANRGRRKSDTGYPTIETDA